MDDNNTATSFETLRGFLNGQEPRDQPYFAYRASLRVFGVIPDLREITNRLGVEPTHSHRRGDRRKETSPPYRHDLWRYTAPLREEEPLHAHIDALWDIFMNKKQHLLEFKRNLSVDVFLGYRSNCDQAGIKIPYDSLKMFTELQIPFGLSIIVA